MKLHFGMGKTYLQGYINIVPQEIGEGGYFSDLRVSLENFSLPKGYLDEVLFDARLFNFKTSIFWLGWFLGVKTWLWRWSNCVRIKNVSLQSYPLILDFFKKIGFEEIGKKSYYITKILRLFFLLVLHRGRMCFQA